jgi:hypothetical protein
VDLTGARLTSRLGGGLTPHQIVAYGVAAIRELFEEAGTFLANRLNRNSERIPRSLLRG